MVARTVEWVHGNGAPSNARAILNSAEVERAVRAEAEQVAARARALAPVDSGELKSSISVKTEKKSGAKNDRVVGVVEASGSHSLTVEFGNSGRRGTFFMRRAANG